MNRSGRNTGAKQKASPVRDPRAGARERPNTAQANDLIWGVNAVLEDLVNRPRHVHEVLVQKGKAGARIQEIIDAARQAKVKVRFVDQERMGLAPGCRHQGVAARRSEAGFVSLDQALDRAAAGSGRILILDSIQDPRNLGSMLRSALAAGFTSVLLTRERSAPLSGVAAQASAGALSRLAIARVVNLANALDRVKDQGFWVYGAVTDRSAASMYTADLSGRMALVIGSEAKGIRPLVQRHCDALITIPMSTDFDSLNASVAAALVMFEAVRREHCA